MAYLRMMFAGARPYLPTVLYLAMLIIASCSDDDSEPNAPVLPQAISGTVVNADGNAVEGAGIVVSLWPSVTWTVKTDETTCLEIPGLQNKNLEAFWITDYCHETVRVLCDGDCPDEGVMIWDGKNDAGKQVTDGVYYANIQLSDTLEVQDFVLVRAFMADWTHATDEFSALTNANGRFEIAQDCLPFGHVFDITDENGEVVDTGTISRWVHFVAVDATDQKARQDSVFVHEEQGAEVTIQFP